MDFIKKFEFTPLNILKALGLLIVALFVLSIILDAFGVNRGSLINTRLHLSKGMPSIQTMSGPGYGLGGGNYAEDAAYEMEGEMVRLSSTNAASLPPHYGGSIGGAAEEYEVTEYNATIETRNKEDVCSQILSLKERDYIVFENSNEYERGCSYTFKVEHEYASETLSLLESLHPRDLSENTYTIQKQISDFTSEEEILKGKLSSIDDTLQSALRAYDNVTALATRTGDAEALAKVVDSKIGVIERLTRERINITAQLERLVRAKETQLDKLVYTYFYVNVYENKFIDGDSLKDSWKSAVKEFVRDINTTIQNVTVGLLALLIVLAQYILYFFILLIVIKYLWRITKEIWKK